jgi:hypothetical protein
MATRREEIEAALKTNLAGITVAAGYALTVNKVERGLQHPDNVPGPEMPIVFLAGSDEDRKNITVSNFKSRMSVTLVGYVENNNSHEALQQDLNALIGAITKRIHADPKLGGLATWSDVASVTTDKGHFAPKAVCEMVVDVEYVRPGIEP